MQTIETARLRLRGFMLEDMLDLYEYAMQPDVGPNAGWKPHEDLFESQAFLLEFMASKECWAIAEKESGKVIGSIALRPDKRRNHDRAKNIGYVLNHDYWGQGYMTEAVQAVLHYGFTCENLLIISIEHFPFNKRSQRVIEKSGFVYEGIVRKAQEIYDGQIYDHICYSLTKAEFEQAKQTLDE